MSVSLKDSVDYLVRPVELELFKWRDVGAVATNEGRLLLVGGPLFVAVRVQSDVLLLRIVEAFAFHHGEDLCARPNLKASVYFGPSCWPIVRICVYSCTSSSIPKEHPNVPEHAVAVAKRGMFGIGPRKGLLVIPGLTPFVENSCWLEVKDRNCRSGLPC